MIPLRKEHARSGLKSVGFSTRIWHNFEILSSNSNVRVRPSQSPRIVARFFRFFDKDISKLLKVEISRKFELNRGQNWPFWVSFSRSRRSEKSIPKSMPRPRLEAVVGRVGSVCKNVECMSTFERSTREQQS